MDVDGLLEKEIYEINTLDLLLEAGADVNFTEVCLIVMHGTLEYARPSKITERDCIVESLFIN